MTRFVGPPLLLIFGGMKANREFVLNAVAQFNELCFDGVLPPVPVVMTKARTYLGKVTFCTRRGLLGRVTGHDSFAIRISTSFDLTQQEWEDVIIHELIHYFIAWRGIRDTSVHGQEFRKMMAEINHKYGRHMSVSHKCKAGELEPKPVRIRNNFVCVTRLQDGNWGVTVAARTRVLYLHRALPRYYQLRGLSWYETADPFFARFPHSISPKIYRISEEELTRHLVGATPLKCNGRAIGPA